MDKEARNTFNFYKKNNLPDQNLQQLTSSEDLVPPTIFPEQELLNSFKVPTSSITPGETHQLIVNSLKAAKLESYERTKISKERQILISKALRIQNSKEFILDKLTEEQRHKLKALALSVLQANPTSFDAPKKGKKKKRG